MSEINDKIAEMQRTVEEFKSTNDQNLQSRDVLLDEKTTALNTRIDTLNDQIAELVRNNVRPATETAETTASDFKAELRAYVLDGVNTRALAAVNVNTGTNANGGFLVPEEFDKSIVNRAVDVSPLLSEVTVLQCASPDVKIHANVRGTTSAWVDETGTDGQRAETATPTIAETAVPFGALFAKPLISLFALNDIYFDVEGFVQENVGVEFSQKVNASILNGTGTGQPKGILANTTAATADAARAWGTIQHIASGTSAALPTGFDKYIDTVYALKAQHRANAKWTVSRATLAELRKVKDDNGQYLWQASNVAGQPGTFLGYGIVESEDMPALAANSLSVLFGDLKEYRLYDLVGMTMLRDPYSYDAFIALKAMKRFGGTIANSEAFKVIKASAS